jgi:hypothetical protein
VFSESLPSNEYTRHSMKNFIICKFRHILSRLSGGQDAQKDGKCTQNFTRSPERKRPLVDTGVDGLLIKLILTTWYSSVDMATSPRAGRSKSQGSIPDKGK